MDNMEAQPHVGSYVTPLIISGAGILCSCLALAVYHLILLRFCLRVQRMRQRDNTNPEATPLGSGLDDEILNKIPILSYSTNKGEVFRLDQSECAICLGDLEDGELVRLLPACTHAFHISCIDQWFTAHSNCPVCRSTLTSLPSLPIASENDAQQSLSHVPPLHNDPDLCAPPSRSQALLRHSLSLTYHTHEKSQSLLLGLKRSLSMDHSSYIDITIQAIQIEQEKASTSSSSSSAKEIGISQSKARSLRQLDHMSMFMRSFSQFRNSKSGRWNEILPN